MAPTREEVRDVLAQHVIGTTDLSCRRCDRTYQDIVNESIPCDTSRPIRPEPGSSLGRRPGDRLRNRATGPGYVDARRPHLSWIRLVCEPELREQLIDTAERAGVSMSEVVRRACRRYVGLPE